MQLEQKWLFTVAVGSFWKSILCNTTSVATLRYSLPFKAQGWVLFLFNWNERRERKSPENNEAASIYDSRSRHMCSLISILQQTVGFLHKAVVCSNEGFSQSFNLLLSYIISLLFLRGGTENRLQWNQGFIRCYPACDHIKTNIQFYMFLWNDSVVWVLLGKKSIWKQVLMVPVW